LREEVRALAPGLAVYAVEPLDAAVARGRMAQKLLGTWLAILAGIALLLASVGLYALTAHNVVQRTREIGVRVALGAPVGGVIWLFVRRSTMHVALGLTLGMAGALSVGKLFGQYLRDGGARDYETTALVTLVLVAIATVASLVPARRASRVDPIAALRHE
jgi:putative ABC transport system permease protein